jgi:hypothetical protein
LSILLGTGTGAFEAQVTYPAGTSPYGVAVGDFDGDGNADLSVANQGAATAGVLLNSVTQTATAVATGVSIPGSGTGHLVDASYPGDTNFSTSVSATTSLTSTQVTTSVALTASAASSTYGQSIELTATLSPSTVGGLATAGETVTFLNGATTIGTATLDSSGVATLTLTTLPAGTSSLTAVYPGDPNFLSATSSPLSFSVGHAVLTVTANALSKVYGSANPTLTYAMTGFLNTDTQASATTGAPTLTTTAVMSSPPATYPIIATVGTLTAANYTFTFVAGTLTVTEPVLTVTASNLSMLYGAAIPTLTYTMTGFVNGDTQATATSGAPVLATTATPSSIVGSYPISAAVGSLAATNYTFSFVAGTLNILQATPVITWATPATIPFGTMLSNT